jgi:hypothetical protein
LHVQSRNTGRGVHGCGELKDSRMSVGEGKPKSTQQAQACEALGLKGPEVTTVKLETERSTPEQVEARRKLGEGPIGC